MANEVQAINVIFDGPPAPDAGRFVEVEDDRGRSLSIGEWIERPDGLWALRIPGVLAPPQPEREG
ncbi:MULTISPECIES: hypothetical protein [Kribbella]|uniref:Uncharacterized protein n=1 Tax=Kribbella pratensis TaxID=2512112 RepID=A0ABY2FQH0_9ACTN|nr:MULTISPECIES: hypothetical protein [Kribbella]TDW95370.1 hypothetical protein EV137_2705 [Kribbella pratensis]TDX03981.1 hypothetical protein EV647_2232 [Kribbella sp. VKM Ac-2566]